MVTRDWLHLQGTLELLSTIQEFGCRALKYYSIVLPHNVFPPLTVILVASGYKWHQVQGRIQGGGTGAHSPTFPEYLTLSVYMHKSDRNYNYQAMLYTIYTHHVHHPCIIHVLLLFENRYKEAMHRHYHFAQLYTSLKQDIRVPRTTTNSVSLCCPSYMCNIN